MFKKLVIMIGMLVPLYAMEQASEPVRKKQKRRSSLQVALGGKSADRVLQLIHKGANVQARDREGNAPLHLAVCSKFTINEIIDICNLLFKKDADVNARNNDGDTPLHCLVKSRWMNNDSISLLRLFLEYGAESNVRNNEGNTPLHCGITRISDACLKLLLGSGSEVNAVNNAHRTPLHLALIGVSPGCEIQELIHAGADILSTDNEGKTPLDYAQKKSGGCYYIVKGLLSRHAKTGLRGNETLEEQLVLNRNFLVQNGIDNQILFSALLKACEWVDLKTASYLLQLGVTVDNKVLFRLVGKKDCWVMLASWVIQAALDESPMFVRDFRNETPLHLIISIGLFERYMDGLYVLSARSTFPVNVASHVLSVPIPLLMKFHVLKARLQSYKNSNNPIPAPELEGVWQLILPHAKSLFIYDIICALVESDKQLEKGVDQDYIKKSALLRKTSIEIDLCKELRTHSRAELLSLRRVADELGNAHFSEILDRLIFEFEKELDSNVVINPPLFEDENESMNLFFANATKARLSQQYLKISGTLKQLAADVDLQVDVINLPNIELKIFEHIHSHRQTLLLLANLENHKATFSRRRIAALRESLMKLLKGAFNNLLVDEVRKVIFAAHYLHIEPIMSELTELYARHCSLDFVKRYATSQSITLVNVLETKISECEKIDKNGLENCMMLLSQLPTDIRKIVISKLHPSLAENLVQHNP